jgi:hypothetical protein
MARDTQRRRAEMGCPWSKLPRNPTPHGPSRVEPGVPHESSEDSSRAREEASRGPT